MVFVTMSFFKKIGKAVSKTAKTVAKTTKTVANKTAAVSKTAVTAVGKQSTYTAIGKGAVVAGKGAIQGVRAVEDFKNEQLKRSIMGPLGIAKDGLAKIGLDGSFFGPLGTFIKYLPLIAIIAAMAWFMVEWRKGSSNTLVIR